MIFTILIVIILVRVLKIVSWEATFTRICLFTVEICQLQTVFPKFKNYIIIKCNKKLQQNDCNKTVPKMFQNFSKCFKLQVPMKPT